MPKDSGPKPQPIGIYGAIPTPAVETTVITPGSVKGIWGALVTGIHVLTWVMAAILIGVWNNGEMDKVTGVPDNMKTLGGVYWGLIIGILIMAVLHSAFARNDPNEQVRASLMSVLLLTLVFFDFAIGCANLAYSATTSSSDYYMAAATCQLVVTAGTAMILSFMVNWSHNGNVAALAEMLKGEGPSGSAA
jgi:hypothetical protein